MSEQNDYVFDLTTRFQQIAVRILEHAGFACINREPILTSNPKQALVIKREDKSYRVEFLGSRRESFTSERIFTVTERLVRLAKTHGVRPLIVVGGVLSPVMRKELLGKSAYIVILEIEHLMFMAHDNDDLYYELLAQLPYSVSRLAPKEPNFQPVHNWNEVYCLEQQRKSDILVSEATTVDLKLDIGNTINGGEKSAREPEKPLQTGAQKSVSDRYDRRKDRKACYRRICNDLRGEILFWEGGQQSASADYEKLCTRTLMRLFADDLTLWNEQAKSNSDLYRFDLICKIKRDNHKDFWEMAERYFDSKYIIFEFKNYAGKVTQKEVYTTVRYLYPTALRRVAIIISPNGIDDHADKAIRGVLRDEGKLILSLTNAELIHMLQMKENGEDPADYLSDMLDELLIDLEK